MENALEELLEKHAIEAHDLDEIVHDVASELASNANSGGVTEQISFLTDVACWTEAEIKEYLLSTSSSDG